MSEKSQQFLKDSRGWLLPIDFSSIPFSVKRAFFIKNVPFGAVRGEHAHFITEQVLFCTGGEVEVSMFDGVNIKSSTLQEGGSIYIPNLIWGKQTYKKPDTSILVVASTEYNKDDYITDINAFMALRGNK